MQAADVPGLGISLFNNNRTVYKRTFGSTRIVNGHPMQPDTVFYGASLSKPVFSVLVMQLAEEGLLDLDRPLVHYLQHMHKYKQAANWWKDFWELEEDPRHRLITARMCLNHTSGLPNWRWHEPEMKLRLKFTPGAMYSYSGEGYCFLQDVVERITNRSLEQLARDRIFRPLDMRNSSYVWQYRFDHNFCFGHTREGEIFPKDKDNGARAASTLETTLDDYTTFLEAVLLKKLLSTNSTDEMFTPQVRIRTMKQFGPLAAEETDRYDDIGLSYGLGWGLVNTPYGRASFKEGHGSGFSHYCVLFPCNKSGMLIMSNSFAAEGIFQELGSLLLGDTFSPWEWKDYKPYNQ
jgi:D-alanyl-D-alanine-carboxypeptidase/D-alanyl-D-alanine-endopeptidase